MSQPLPAGAVLVADEVVGGEHGTLPCPAAILVDGELRRRAVAVHRGVLDLSDIDGDEATWVSLGDSALAVAARKSDGEARIAARTALSAWLAVSGTRTVLLAAPRAFCAGVERAVKAVEQALDQREGTVYVRKQIVHNRHVVSDLESRGAVFVDELAAVPADATVVFSAHGVSPAVHTEAAERGLDVIDATCPLVTKVHAEARRFATRGDTIVLIGHAGHEEVEGTLGEAPESTLLVQSVADVATLRVPDPSRVSYLTQTTLAVDETADIVAALRARFPALRGPDSADICYATTNRQDAVRAIARDADLVLVLGSTNSSNSLRLVELAERHDTPAHLIDDIRDLRPEWLTGTRTIGLTAGASAPPHLVDEAIAALAGLGPLTVTEIETAQENIQFMLPSPVRHR
ncbi:4-hydroxy-3-methylbut-2-enyl diphosphate reductase [Actinokineospora sp.]|uniref:4-hydroxy-3-methylbut-2-enyl diphosphate reductase n=1 Tax=Actinokineospora sp. TaxID=1872133 RepID=UPI00403847B0